MSKNVVVAYAKNASLYITLEEQDQIGISQGFYRRVKTNLNSQWTDPESSTTMGLSMMAATLMEVSETKKRLSSS